MHRINNTKLHIEQLKEEVDMTRLGSKVLKYNIEEGSRRQDLNRSSELETKKKLQSVQTK